jgi:hypothetical protein
MELTDVRLEQIGKRLERSNMGPWQATTTEWLSNWVVVDGRSLVVAACDHFDSTTNADNATFIAHARQDIHVLLTEVTRLRELMADLASDSDHQAFVGWSERMMDLQHRCDAQKNAMEEAYRQLRKAQSVASTDGPVFNRGRVEGQSDVAARLRAILDPSNSHNYNIDGLMKEVIRLKKLDGS